MDTPYVAVILVIFLVVAGLVVDVGYLYVDRDELQQAAERGAMAGVTSIHERHMAQLRTDPRQASGILEDTDQRSARGAVRGAVLGNHESAAVIGIGGGDSAGEDEEILVGRWENGTFAPGMTPVNAVQVTTHRTAEHSVVGIGNLGRMFARLVGTADTGSTATATAVLRPFLRPGAAISADKIPPGCLYPTICTVPGTTVSLDGNGAFATALTVAVSAPETLSTFVCSREPRQEVCGKSVSLHPDNDGKITADLASLMYDPSVDPLHKEIDPALDRVSGWWILLPVVPVGSDNLFATVTRYALVRVNRICPPCGMKGCSRGAGHPSGGGCCSDRPFLTFDRATVVDCTLHSSTFPGFDPILVHP